MKHRKQKELPLSNAKTAYSLLQDVKKAILEEPKRVNMTTYYKETTRRNAPACGTVGCFAGWVCILAGIRKENSYDLSVDDDGAREVLGDNLDYDTANGYNVFNSGDGDDCKNTKPGTVEHARAVVNRINRFMQVNKAKLIKRKLGRGPAPIVPLLPVR